MYSTPHCTEDTVAHSAVGFFCLSLSQWKNKRRPGIAIPPMDEGDDAGLRYAEDSNTGEKRSFGDSGELHEGIFRAAATAARKDGGNSRERGPTTEDEAGRRRTELEAQAS